ncbi:hypothetical protein [Roseofilum casamattae]|uniref:DUF3718 domain-containing protein n=1 Tax=Roseofilum casamattae BLCC-M143 TaxID=3022442 RepID=A0ABT7C2F3_9CYAN|nr:hypothetical protein [Roseofilum casamattae]MDJ1185643.1 hypothetical protein [Roseofilum casamattae BLCC-M143]
MKTLRYWISVTLSTVILGAPLAALAGPTLYYEKLWIEDSVSGCLQRAENAISQAGVPILNANKSRVLAVSPTVSVAIDCELIEEKIRAVLMVTSAGDNPTEAIDLTQQLKQQLISIEN